MLKITIDLTDADIEMVAPVAGKTGLLKWIHLKDGEGVCPECAPFIGMVKDAEDWEDEPPLHPHCQCELVPVGAEGATAMPEQEEFGWLEKLSATDLAAIVGEERAALVAAGKVTVRGLYTRDLSRLLTMEELQGGVEDTPLGRLLAGREKARAEQAVRRAAVEARKAQRAANAAAKRAAKEARKRRP